MYIESKENLGCNFFALKNTCRKHTDAYRGIKAAQKYSARVGPDRTIMLSLFSFRYLEKYDLEIMSFGLFIELSILERFLAWFFQICINSRMYVFSNSSAL